MVFNFLSTVSAMFNINNGQYECAFATNDSCQSTNHFIFNNSSPSRLLLSTTGPYIKACMPILSQIHRGQPPEAGYRATALVKSSSQEGNLHDP